MCNHPLKKTIVSMSSCSKSLLEVGCLSKQLIIIIIQKLVVKDILLPFTCIIRVLNVHVHSAVIQYVVT